MGGWGWGGGAVKSPLPATAVTPLTLLKPLYSLVIPEVNFSIGFLVDEFGAPVGLRSRERTRRDAVKSCFFSE